MIYDINITNSKEEIINLYKTESNKIFNFIHKMTGDENVSEDILQETFICALQKIGTFRGESTLSTWIFSIAKNYCLQHLRKIKRMQFSEMEELIDFVSDDKDDSQYNNIEKKIYIMQIKEGCLLGLLRCLPLNQRLAFILNVLHEIPVEETAKIIKKSIRSNG